ncbi:MAG: PilN domain-containing protein [Candidatus Paceibacterota bacterium]
MPEYNKSVTEKFLEPEKLPVGWPWRLFIFSIVLFVLVLFIYFGMIWGYQPYLNSSRQSLDGKINEIGGTISEADRENFVNFYSQLVNLQSLLGNHVKGSNIYNFLETNTNQGVYYDGADLSAVDHLIRLDGVANSYDNLFQQLAAFEQAPNISKVVLEQAQAADRGIRFSIQVIFKPELIKP